MAQGAFLLSTLLVLPAAAETGTSASKFTAIPVPKNVIYAGQIIRDSLLRERRVPLEYLDRVSVMTSRLEVVGKVARTTLMPSRPISVNHVSEPDVVKVSKPTFMEYRQHALRITAEVLPLNSAKEGEFVRARNIHTGVIVSGTARKNGTISAGTGPGSSQ